MKLLGHKTDQVFRRYAIVDSAMLADAGLKLQGFNAVQDRKRPMTPYEVS